MKVAVKILAKSCFLSGFNVQSFTIGRSGIVKAEKTEITSKEFTDPDYYIILDQLMANVKMFKEGSIAIFNSPSKIISPKLKKIKVKAYAVDATGISVAHVKMNRPAIPMIGAVPKLFGKITMKSLKTAMEDDKVSSIMLEEGHKSVK